MPPYPGNNQAPLLYENNQAFFFLNEAVAAGQLSQAFQIRRERGNFYPNGFSLEVAFSADPGTFEIDLVSADTDNANYYVPIAIINSVNTSFVGRVELNDPLWAKYVACYVRTLTNAVSLTAQGTR
jgi:hypothetical protein